MSKKITRIQREVGYVYKVDKDGNVIKEKYNILKDPYTIVTIAILILGCLYWMQITEMRTTEANFEGACIKYMQLRDEWIQEHPGRIPTLDEVFIYSEDETRTKYYK